MRRRMTMATAIAGLFVLTFGIEARGQSGVELEDKLFSKRGLGRRAK